jgi:hypothetical protein
MVNGNNGNGNGNGNTQATTVATATLVYRRQHPGGGALGRCSYGVPGVAGIVVFDMGLFAPALLAANGGLPPATITINVAMATPQARTGAGVTSAVVAQANTQAATVAAAPAIANPAQVAQVAQAAGAAVVAAAATATPAAAAAAKGAAAHAPKLAGKRTA